MVSPFLLKARSTSNFISAAAINLTSVDGLFTLTVLTVRTVLNELLEQQTLFEALHLKKTNKKTFLYLSKWRYLVGLNISDKSKKLTA